MRLLPRLEAADQLHGGGALGSRAPGAAPGLVLKPLLPPQDLGDLVQVVVGVAGLGSMEMLEDQADGHLPGGAVPQIPRYRIAHRSMPHLSTPPSSLLRPNLLHRPRAHLVRHRKPPISFLLGPAISQKRCRSRKPLERNTKAPPLWTASSA